VSNQAYNRVRDDLMTGLDLTSVGVRCVAVDSSYIFSAAHLSLADVAGAARIATLGANLSGASVSGGVFSVSNFTFLSVPPGDTITAFIFYVYNATESLATLLAYIDTAPDGTTPVNVVTDGNNVPVTLGAGGIFTMTNPTFP